MKRIKVYFFAAVLVTFPIHLSAKGTFRIAPPGGWIKKQTLVLPNIKSNENQSKGLRAILYDNQVKVTAKEQFQYFRYADKITHKEGIDRVSKITMTFNPSYETLTIHEVNIRRKGRIIRKLFRRNVQILHRERELEERVYNGRISAHILLDGVKNGDIVDYSYTIKGSNPVFGNGYYDSFVTKGQRKISRLHIRLLVNRERPIYIKKFRLDADPNIVHRGNFIEYTWLFKEREGVDYESDIPYWYSPFPWIQVTDMKDWSLLSKWALGHFAVPRKKSSRLKALIKRIKSESKSKELMVTKALSFVQDDIRYTSLSIGENSHVPADPSVVLKRRYGDCKDKSMLLVAMLQEMGIKAYPVLVSTDRGPKLNEYLPSPNNFNHVIVLVKHSGKEYWLDPTISRQGGTLEKRYQPDYGYAFVVTSDTEELRRMLKQNDEKPTIITRERYDCREGLDKPALFNVTTEFTSYSADYIRRSIASSSVKDLQKKYMNFYAKRFIGLTLKKKMKIEDFKDDNRVIITETYSIPELFSQTEKKDRKEVTFYPGDLSNYFSSPETIDRKLPLRIEYPNHVKFIVTVDLPEEFSIEPESETIKNEYHHFYRKVEYGNKRLFLEYNFRTLKDHLPVKDINIYIKSLRRLNRAVGYMLYDDRSTEVEIDKPTEDELLGLLVIILMVFPTGLLIFRIHKYHVKKNDISRNNEYIKKEQDIAASEEKDDSVVVTPSVTGKRFINYIVDLIFLAIFYLYLFIINEVLKSFSAQGAAYIEEMLENVISFYLFMLVYYFIFERFSGKTPGKYFTKTIVVKKDRSEINSRDILYRSLARLIPFEILSFLGSSQPEGWHDSLSHTVVIDDK